MSERSTEVRNEILNAAIEEFAENGYEAASTNTITRRAGVSKGLLFHYFKNKEGLYIACYEHVLKWSQTQFEDFAEKAKRLDFFEFLREWGLRKIQLAIEKPVYAKFLLTVTNLPAKLRQKIVAMIKETLLSSFHVISQKIDSIELRQGLSKEDATMFVTIFFDGMAEFYLNQYRDRAIQLPEELDEIKKQMDRLIDVLKFGLLER
ncbi:MAG: TetR/AcrR family transcriptional regulator [Thermotoga caldifontis]|uniref:TetR/AcrR family transcriptional regulator n=1 Tax=Thermotoga caldifontis TaxID=1508419 RepID=UPI003C7ADA5D